ncbi:YhdP family protein [Psychromonas aquatilis]|uniref:YhdP family protein n=1 Tax=Psychromonas aquatilis TaxID=2005072 RepID=A0ABU9GQ02_9GAMM
MIHFTAKWLKRLSLLIAIILIMVAMLVTIARFTISNVDNYKGVLVEWIAQEHGLNVDAQKISAGIDFSGLVITLNEVTFTDSNVLPFQLSIDDLFLHFDFFASIQQQRIVFNDISIKGADLLLKSMPADPNAILHGTLGPEPQTQSEITLDSLKNIFLSRLSSFKIADSRLRFTDQLNHQKAVLIETLSWVNKGTQHQGIGQAKLANTLQKNNNLSFIINLTGDEKSSNEQLLGTLFVNADKVDASPFLTPNINPLAKLSKALVSFKLWGTFDFNGPKAMQLAFKDSELAWSMLDQGHHWQLSDGYLQLSYQQKHWLFDSYDLTLSDNLIANNDIKLTGAGVQSRSGHFDLTGVNVSDLVPLGLLFSDLTEPDMQKVIALELGGQVTQFGVKVDQQDELSFSLKINDLNSQSVGYLPAINDADITLMGNNKKGEADIQIAEQSLNFNGQFNRAIPLKQAAINLQWQVDSQGLELSSDNLVIETDEVDSSSAFSILFPKQPPNTLQATKTQQALSPLLTLYSIISLDDASAAEHYYPMKLLGKNVYTYLQPTLKKGAIKDAKILWSGHLGDFPFRQHQGIFQASIPVSDAKYDFFPGWQGLNNIDLLVYFENDSISMRSQNGQLGDIKLNKLSANIDHLNKTGRLSIEGEVNDKAALIADYLVDSPLQESIGKAVNLFKIKGNLAGTLSLNIPFSKADTPTQAKGKLTLKGNDIDIVLGEQLLPLEEVQGEFSFNNGNLLANHLTGTLFKQPINVSFSSQDLNDKYQLEANLDGRWNMTKLSQQYKSLQPLQLSGELAWQGKIDFMQPKDKPYQFALSLDSQLQGVKVDLPAPFNKNAFQKWATKVSASANRNGIQWVTSINNKLKSNGELIYIKDKPKLKYLYLGLGKDAGLNIDKSKQVIRINEHQLNLSPWVSIIKDNLLNKSKAESTNTLFAIDSVQLNVKHAKLFEQPLVNLNASLNKSNNKWHINVQADDLGVKAEYRQGIPDRFDVAINQLNFDSFNFSRFQQAWNGEQTGLNEISSNLREKYPEVFLECIECHYADMNLSPLKMHVYPSSVHYNIDYLSVGSDDQMTTMSGVWNQSRTNMIVQGQGNSQTSMVKRLGYSSPMVFEQGEVEGAFDWVGAPWQFNLDSLNGSLKLSLNDGNITEIDDKGARLLSLLSLDGIWRSLNSEFGNVFSKGLSFDKMSLSGKIKNGIFKSDDYALDGSVGKIAGSGLVDLPNLNVNYRFSYSPAVTSSLPVLATFAINPLTGAALLMLTEILEPVVDSIVRVDFSVKGSVLNPKVEIENRQRGTVKLQNSEILEALETQ